MVLLLKSGTAALFYQRHQNLADRFIIMTALWIKALRLKHWVKNFFVLAPFLIGPRFGLNIELIRACIGAMLFGLIASAIYIMNDIVDIESDRQHPKKRLRPIAAGQIGIPTAKWVSTGLLFIGLSSSVALSINFAICLALYLANNILYSYYFKKKTVLDVMSIAFGFVLRAYAGGVLVGLEITNWMIVCVFCLSLLLGFGKRRAEMEKLSDQAAQVRKVHESYTPAKLDILLAISASVTIVAYILYCIDPITTQLHHTNKLIFTTPFVLYCIYRYTLKVQERKEGDGPVELILNDRGFILAGSMWLLSFILLIHL